MDDNDKKLLAVLEDLTANIDSKAIRSIKDPQERMRRLQESNKKLEKSLAMMESIREIKH